MEKREKERFNFSIEYYCKSNRHSVHRIKFTRRGEARKEKRAVMKCYCTTGQLWAIPFYSLQQTLLIYLCIYMCELIYQILINEN